MALGFFKLKLFARFGGALPMEVGPTGSVGLKLRPLQQWASLNKDGKHRVLRTDVLRGRGVMVQRTDNTNEVFGILGVPEEHRKIGATF